MMGLVGSGIGALAQFLIIFFLADNTIGIFFKYGGVLGQTNSVCGTIMLFLFFDVLLLSRW